MSTAIRTELLKLRTTRLAAGLLALAAGLTTLVAVIESARAGTGDLNIPALSSAEGLRAIVTNTGFAMLVSAVFGVTVATGEFRHQTATDTYLDQPNRTRILAAKLLAAAGVGLLFGLVASVIATTVGLAVAAAKGYQIAISTSTIAGYLAGAVLACGLLAAVGVGIGSLVRGQLVALIAVFVWAMAVEQIVGGLAPEVGRFLPFLAATTLGGANSSASMPPVPPDLQPLAPAAIVVLLTGLALLLGAIATRTTLHRDIT
jgi:ABC-type transport system involved in multi-copper enzyme maturation permease subunit